MPRRGWPAGWVLRCARDQDVAGIVDLLNARSRRFASPETWSRQDVERWWNGPRFDREQDFRVLIDLRRRVVGIASADNRGAPYAFVGCHAWTHPDCQDDDALWDGLYRWSEERALDIAELADDGVRAAAVEKAHDADEARRRALGRAGFGIVRVENRMAVDLGGLPSAPEWPPHIRVRAADVDADEAGLIDAYQETWRDHWGYVERPRVDVAQSYRSMIEREGDLFDPSLWLIAVDGDEIAGFVMAQAHIGPDATKGFIAGLGVRPAWRRQGLGLALLREAFRALHRRGIHHIELDMDSENLTGALRLYTRAGMRVARRVLVYEKELRPGLDLATRALRG